ncbi:MAG: hypothetical protein WBD67_00915, partial [Terracidiphilus sp.]
ASLAERGLRRQAEALSLGAWQRRSELARRVHSLLLRHRALNPIATRALLGVLGCGLLAGSVELARAPQMVAFVAAPPAHPVAQINTEEALPAHSSAPAAALALLHPPRVHTRLATHTLRAEAPRSPALLQPSAAPSTAPSAAPSAALLAALQPDSNSVSAASAEPASTRSAPAPEWVASNAPAPRSGLSERPASVSTAPDPAQEWIVFTAWQQVQTESVLTDSPATRTQASADHTDKVLDSAPTHRITTRFTITRVFFRVVPASSVPTNAAALPMREGWLVLQI